MNAEDISQYYDELVTHLTGRFNEVIVVFDIHKADSLKNKTRKR